MKGKALIISFLMAAAWLPADAQRRNRRNAPAPTPQQDTTIKGATIEIIQSYKPEVATAPKPQLTPGLPPVDTTTPTLKYEVPQQTLSYTYSSFPLRPLALGIDTVNMPFANYIKAGAGNLSTLYLDAGIGSLRGENFDANFHIGHISQAGDIKHQKSSLSSISADGVQHRDGHAFHANFDISRNQFYYYGYDHETLNFSDDSVKQAYTGISFGIDLQNETEGIFGLNYHPFIKLSLYSDRFDGVENTFGIGLPVSYDIDTNLQIYAGVTGTFTNYKKPFLTQNNNVVELTPGIRYRKGNFEGHAGINPTFGRSDTYLLPDIDLNFHANNSQFTIFAGWKGRLMQNTFEQLSTRNPYMYDRYTVRQTKADEIYAGLRSNLGEHISFSGRVSYWRYDALPMFINDTATDSKQFLILYDNVNALGIQASVRYQIAQTLAIGLGIDWYNYKPETQKQVWHEPGIRLKSDVLIKPLKDLAITGYLSVMDENYALTKGGRASKLSPVLDLGANAEYTFIPRLSAFIQINNLLNNRYERWMGYEAYGLNVYGGLRLKF